MKSIIAYLRVEKCTPLSKYASSFIFLSFRFWWILASLFLFPSHFSPLDLSKVINFFEETRLSWLQNKLFRTLPSPSPPLFVASLNGFPQYVTQAETNKKGRDFLYFNDFQRKKKINSWRARTLGSIQ